MEVKLAVASHRIEVQEFSGCWQIKIDRVGDNLMIPITIYSAINFSTSHTIKRLEINFQ